jgi:hypothetical protein
VPVIALVFSVVSYGAARSIKGTALLARHINIVQAGGGAKLARADAMLWILTPRHASYVVSSPDTQMVLSHTCPENAAEGACNDDTTIREGDPARSLRLEDVDVPMWEQAEFIGQSVLGMGQGIALSKAPGSSGATVHNGTPFALCGAVVVDGQRVYRCGESGAIAAGARAPLQALTAAEQKQLSQQIAAEPGNQIAGIPAPGSSATSAKWRRSGSGRKHRSNSARVFNDAVHAQRTLYAKLIYAGHIKELFAPQAGSAAGDETSQHLARTVLSQIMAGQFATTPGSPVLVAWGAAPAAPLILEDESPQQQNVTLFLVHLAG